MAVTIKAANKSRDLLSSIPFQPDITNTKVKITKDDYEREIKVSNGISLSSGLVAGGSIIGLIGIILQVSGIITPAIPRGFAASNSMAILLLIILVIASTSQIVYGKVNRNE